MRVCVSVCVFAGVGRAIGIFCSTPRQASSDHGPSLPTVTVTAASTNENVHPRLERDPSDFAHPRPSNYGFREGGNAMRIRADCEFEGP